MNQAEYKFDTQGKKLKPTHLELFRRMDSRWPDQKTTLEGALILYSSPRCGSTLFSDTLNQTGLLGYCEEWFNYEYFAAWAEITGLPFTLPTYLDWLRIKTGQPFALKIHSTQVKMMKDHFQLEMDYFKPRHEVYLYRRDKVAQAVSLAKAIATNQFRHDEETLGDEQAIDVHIISDCLEKTLRQDAYASVNLVPRCAAEHAYEDYQYDTSVYDDVLKAMGLTPPQTYNTTMKKQSNEHSAKMADVFVRYITGEYL